jgi:hypothetical protein
MYYLYVSNNFKTSQRKQLSITLQPIDPKETSQVAPTHLSTMAKDNDAYVRSVSSHSLPSPHVSDNEDPDEPSEEDVAAFDRVFAQFDPNGLGVVSMRDFLAIIDELDALRPRSAKPLLTEMQREQSQAFTSAEGGTAEMTRNQLFEFIKEMTGNKIIIASPKKKNVPRKEEASPTKIEAPRRGLLPGISARSQVRPPYRKRRGDLEKIADGTTNVVAENEDFSAVPLFLLIELTSGSCCTASYWDPVIQFIETECHYSYCHVDTHALYTKTNFSTHRRVRRIRYRTHEPGVTNSFSSHETSGLAAG